MRYGEITIWSVGNERSAVTEAGSLGRIKPYPRIVIEASLSKSKPILVTGASGVLGRAIVTAFAEGGAPLRQAVRSQAKARSGMDAVRWDYTEPATLAPALAGTGGLLLMAPSLDPDAPAKLAPAVARAKEAGVEHIVFISAFGVNYNEQAPLRIIEYCVMDSALPYTILRPNFFMENFSEGFLAGGIRGQNGIFLAAGDGKTSFISVAGHDPDAERAWFDRYCPLRNVTAQYPPTMLIHGTADTDAPYEESRKMSDKLAQAGVKHELVAVEGAGHGLSGARPEEITRATENAVGLLRAHTA